MVRRFSVRCHAACFYSSFPCRLEVTMSYNQIILEDSMGDVYLQLLEEILEIGQEVHIGRPGAMSSMTKEIMGLQVVLTDCELCLFENSIRNLNYRFQLAEFLWIMAGREDVGSLALYNSQVAKYSDDGRTFAGAYGPRLKTQWEYVQNTLWSDPTSRQAVASIWTPHPAKSRDIPCTLSVQFLSRLDGEVQRLHGIFTMRSSDAFRGIPSDMFCFANIVCWLATGLGIRPGSLTMNLGSSHLYQNDWEVAEEIVQDSGCMQSHRVHWPKGNKRCWPNPAEEILWAPQGRIEIKPWCIFEKALYAGTSEKCLRVLKGVE
jgi:thymidylate synthase